jgi:hypothetical protein
MSYAVFRFLLFVHFAELTIILPWDVILKSQCSSHGSSCMPLFLEEEMGHANMLFQDSASS